MPNRYAYIPFNPADWLASTAILTPLSRGVWMDLLMAMFMADRNDRVSGTAEQLARIARCTPDEAVTALMEIGGAGVAEVSDDDGTWTVVCRRFRREKMEREGEAGRKRAYRQRKRNAGAVGHCPTNVPHVPKMSHGCPNNSTTDIQDTCEACPDSVTGYARVIPITNTNISPLASPLEGEAPGDGQGKARQGNHEGYPETADAVVEAAEKSGFAMSVQDAAEWLRAKQYRGWTIDGRKVASWRMALDGFCRSSGCETTADRDARLEADKARRAASAAERKAAMEAEAARPKLSIAEAIALMRKPSKIVQDGDACRHA